MLLLEAVGDIVLNIEGVKERTFLEDHADVGAHSEYFALGHLL